MFHEGQFEGRRVRVPVFLGRRPDEPIDNDLQAFYQKLLSAIRDPLFHVGAWKLCERSGWPDNHSFENLVAWTWHSGQEFCVVVVNLSDTASQAQVKVPYDSLRERQIVLTDPLSGTTYTRNGDGMLSPGLYVDLQPWNFHLLHGELAAS